MLWVWPLERVFQLSLEAVVEVAELVEQPALQVGFMDRVAKIILFLLTMFACISRFCTVVSRFGSEILNCIAALG